MKPKKTLFLIKKIFSKSSKNKDFYRRSNAENSLISLYANSFVKIAAIETGVGIYEMWLDQVAGTS